MDNRYSILFLFALSLVLIAYGSVPLFASESESEHGRFIKYHWYESGIENGNPTYNPRIRVNAPEVVLHPSFMHRSEVRGNGMILIKMEENPAQLKSASLYMEQWGGHPGTANKRVTVNGRSTYELPEVGTVDHHCTYTYPDISLKILDLVNGYNAFQFACDTGTTFWGHFLIDNVALKAELKREHSLLKKRGLDKFTATVIAEKNDLNEEVISLRLDYPESSSKMIKRVDYRGFYYGYDENGNCKSRDWHGFTKSKNPVAIIGSSDTPPFRVGWDVSMIPSQDEMAVQAEIVFKDEPKVVFKTPELNGLSTPNCDNSLVSIYQSHDLPIPFWSRDNRFKECTIQVDVNPEQVEYAELHVVIWDGGKGDVKEPFTLNGHPLPVAGDGHHDLLYRVIPIQPEILQKGLNTIGLLSDTKHHGIEVLLPGPALVIRSLY